VPLSNINTHQNSTQQQQNNHKKTKQRTLP